MAVGGSFSILGPKKAQATEKSLAEQALGKIGNFVKALTKIDFAALEEEERALIKEELEALKRAIDELIGTDVGCR